MERRRIYSMIFGEDYGDLVYCTNCGKTLLIKCGLDICPMCTTNGCLTWVNDNKEEYTISEVEAIENTVIIPLGKEKSMLIESMDLASQSI